MKHTTPPMRSVALSLVTYETRGKKLPATSKNVVALQACEKLGRQLATLTGTLALRALMTRALTLAAKEVPWLSEVQLTANGSFQGLAELELRLVEENLTDGAVVLLAELLGLLVAFVGDTVTWRVLQDVWPHISPHDWD
jgi:hypothetical protein